MFVQISHSNGRVRPTRNVPVTGHMGELSVNAESFQRWLRETRHKLRKEVYGAKCTNPTATIGGDFNNLIDNDQVVYWSRLP